MKFLEQVAKDILTRFEGNLSNVCVVFPNIRSRFFFNKYLTQYINKPIFLPRYEDINSLFGRIINLQIADKLILNSLLYQSYSKCYKQRYSSKKVEALDEFWFFGEILLNDFDDLDKYIIDAKSLYQNIDDLGKLNNKLDYLDDTQKEILNRFFSDIKDNKTSLKENFSSIWNILYDVYTDFKENLKGENIAYQGMLYREVIDNWEKYSKHFNNRQFVFIGFNLLTKCERKLFENLKDQSLFYWDYDHYYLNNDNFETNIFIQKNLQDFLSPDEFILEADNLGKEKNIKIVSTVSDVSQVGYIPKFIESIDEKDINKEPNTAIVFCSEDMMLPALQFIPDQVEKINVTMGFPINKTPIFDFIIRLLELQQKGISEDYMCYPQTISLLQHPYTKFAVNDSERLIECIKKEKKYFIDKSITGNEKMFSKITEPQQLIENLSDIMQMIGVGIRDEQENFNNKNLFGEAIFRVFQLLNRLSLIIKKDYINLQLPVFISLLKRLLSVERVPFHGEPIRGLQLMGMLETRNMDFKNIMLISMNEGIMPKIEEDTSFIPHLLRKHLGMSTIEHQEAIYSYYFYRLLQRADNVTLVYSKGSGDTSNGEISRFALQLMTELPYKEKIEQINLQNSIELSNLPKQEIIKTDDVITKLSGKYNLNKGGNQILSPTAINSYISCPYSFYLRYIEELKEEEEITDEIDNRIFGNIIHTAMENIFKSINNKNIYPNTRFEITRKDIEEYIKDKDKDRVEKLLLEVFNEKFFNNKKVSKDNYNGKQLIAFNVAKTFVKKMLKFDSKNTPFMVEGLEKYNQMTINTDNGIKINIGGYIDRIISKIEDGKKVIYVDDYKTSSKKEESKIENISSLFDQSISDRQKNNLSYVLQAFYYSYIKSRSEENNTDVIVPRLLFIPRLKDEKSEEYIQYNKQDMVNFREIADDFEKFLKDTIEEIFNKDIPFRPNYDSSSCQYCNFQKICMK